MKSVEYSFGEFRLKLAERELWRRSERLAVPRLAFDCMVYLIEHRDRAVGRDELVAAVWGRADTFDGHLNQTIVRARRVLGDGGQVQLMIRTIPGFGYRWVGEIDRVAEQAVPSIEAMRAGDATADVRADTPFVAEPEPEAMAPASGASAAARPGNSIVRRYAVPLLALLAVLSLAMLIYFVSRTPHGVVSLPHAVDGNAIVVLPITVDGPRESGWVGLGAMDLIADRLRSADLPVPPSETVMAALHGSASPPAAADLDRIRQTLGAGAVVQGKASYSAQGWTVQLEAKNASGIQQRAEARRDDAIQAARAAADLLLASLGRKPPAGVDATDAVQDRLQQAQAAMLTNQLDLARRILSAIPADPKTAPEVRLRLADVDFHSGRLDEAADVLAALLADASVQADNLRRGRVLTLRGNVYFRRSAYVEAARDFDAAIADLQVLSAPLDLGDALTRRGVVRTALRDFDGASADFGRARLLMEQAGDRLRIAHVDAGFGLLQIEQRRLELALPYFDAAIDQYEAFGMVERVVTLRNLLNDTYADLLRWPEALAISERQAELRERIGDPGLALVIANRRGRLLMALGRYREAGEVVADARKRYAGVRPEARRYLYDLEADLASRQGGRPETVIDAVDDALKTWPRDPSYDRFAYLVLLRQRAMIAAGRATPGQSADWLPAADAPGVSPIFMIARAEWAAYRGDDDEAEHQFAQALKTAEANGTPAPFVQVATAYVDWLLKRGRLEPSTDLAGRVAVWARHDFDSALLRVAVFHALGRRDNWATALQHAQELAGERTIPPALRVPPSL